MIAESRGFESRRAHHYDSCGVPTMRNTYNKELIKIAEEIVKQLKTLYEAKAITLGGAIAYGFADKYSDIDIHCFCKKLPDIKFRKKIISNLKLNGIKKQYNVGDSFGQDIFFYKNKVIGIDYIPLTNFNRYINTVIKTKKAQRDDFSRLSKIFQDKILWDPDKIIHKIRKRVKPVVDTSIKFSLNIYWPNVVGFVKEPESNARSAIGIAIKRGSCIWICKLFDIQLEFYLHCLYAINNEIYYNFLTKWAYKKIPTFRYKPKNCVKRLEQISLLGNNPKDVKKKLEIFKTLVKDTEPLIR